MRVHCYEKLEDLPSSYKAVFTHAEHISYDCSFCWFQNLFATTFGLHENIRIFVADDENGLIAILPMYSHVDNWIKPKIIKAATNFYTSLYSPICSDELTAELLAQALQPIKGSQMHWDIVEFSPLAAGSASYEALFDALTMLGYRTFRYFSFANWYLTVGGRSYADYFNALPSRLKNTVNRKRRHFFATKGARLEIIVGGQKLDRGVADYINVYNTSWKVREPFPDFMPGLIKLCADQGWLRLGLAYIDDQPIAAQLWIVAHGRAAIYKLAHDKNLESYSIGSVLTAHIMRHVIDLDKVYEVDYLIGDDDYKKDWMSHRRERWGIVAYNPATFLGWTCAIKQSLGELRRRIFSYVGWK